MKRPNASARRKKGIICGTLFTDRDQNSVERSTARRQWHDLRVGLNMARKGVRCYDGRGTYTSLISHTPYRSFDPVLASLSPQLRPGRLANGDPLGMGIGATLFLLAYHAHRPPGGIGVSISGLRRSGHSGRGHTSCDPPITPFRSKEGTS
jgi:hypothetical protein